MSKRTWIIFIVVVLGLMTALVVSSRNSRPQIDLSSVDINSIQKASKANGNIAEHIFGKADSKVVLIEYGDFQCPACGKSYPSTKKISQDYKNMVAFVFRNYPLPATTHPNAKAASATAESAGLQGKFWEMHDLLYENQPNWSNLTEPARTNMFVGYAKTLGLDEAKFKTDLAGSAVAEKVAYDQAIGVKIGVEATPTYYLDGTKLDEPTGGDIQNGNGDKLRALIDTELKKAGITPATNTQ